MGERRPRGRSSSGRVLRALAPYGCLAGFEEPSGSGEARARSAALLVDRLDEAGGVGLITGPSGAGKSRLLGSVCATLLERGVAVVRCGSSKVDGQRPVAGIAGRVPLDEWLGCLSRAGLADARLLATRAADLSVGEKARLSLALAFAARHSRSAGERPCWLVCDEFCSVLDRATAAGVASAAHRWAARTGARLIVASAHADLARLAGPRVIARVEPGGTVAIEQGAGVVRAGRVRTEAGSIEDYGALSRFHYRGARPVSVVRVLRATVADDASGRGVRRLAGVLVVSYPTLNGAWREFAWPGRYVGSPGARRRLARRLNKEVRRITRVVVDPRDRGRGVATALVRAYLDDPLTPATEAVSAMGRLSPFNRSAGMVEYALPPRAPDDRLGDMLDAMGLAPWMLLDGELIAGLRGTRDGAWLARELGVWGRAVGASVPVNMRTGTDALAPLAAARLCAPPIAYAHS